MRKETLVLILLIVCTVFFSESVYAKNENYICNVDQVGSVGSKQTRVMLTHEGGDFTQKWFLAKDSRKKEMLAILLSAVYGNMQVKVRTDISKDKFPEILNLYIIAP
jgi:hypothetical protein